MSWDEINNNASEKTNFTTFGEGSTIIRVVQDEPFSRWSHWMPRAKRSITCPGKGCPICNLIKSAKANKETPQYSSSKRHSINVINRNTERLEIMEQGKGFFQSLLDLNKEVGKVSDYDIKVIRKGLDMNNTTYTLIPLPAKPLSPEDEAMKSGIIDLKEYMKAPTNEQIIQLINGADPKEVFKQNESEEEIGIETGTEG